MQTALAQTNGAIASIEDENSITTLIDPSSIEQTVKAEVDIQISTAKRYPRSIRQFTQQALEMATFDEQTAAGCFYSLPRGGKPIEGPSVRLAEIIVSAWGNVRAEARVTGADAKEITAEAVVWDLEKNTAVRVAVKRRITDKYGKRYNDDMVTVTGNAACAIAFRNAVFKVIPKVYTDNIYRAARQTAIGDIKTLAAKRAEMVEYFGKMGITPDRVFATVEKKHLEEIGLDELATLKGMATAIKEGDLSIDEAFPSVDLNGATGVSGLKERMAKRKEAEPASDPPDFVDPSILEPPAETGEPTEAELLEALRANTQAAFDELPKNRQKDLIAGKRTISQMSEDELKLLLAEMAD